MYALSLKDNNRNGILIGKETTSAKGEKVMKKLSLNPVTLALVLLIAGTLWMSAPAHAWSWVDMHGTNGEVEYVGNTTGVGYKGWGLDFTEKPNLGNWVHYQIPTSLSRKVQYLFLQYYKSSAAGSINMIHLYDGRVKVREIAVPAITAGSWISQVINLGAPITFANGLGISLGMVNGAANTNFKIGDMAARFE
jgi:hypothetical protein